MSNFGKKYRKDPVKKFNRERESVLKPKRKRNTRPKTQSYSKRKNKPVEITSKEFLFWLVILGTIFIFTK